MECLGVPEREGASLRGVFLGGSLGGGPLGIWGTIKGPVDSIEGTGALWRVWAPLINEVQSNSLPTDESYGLYETHHYHGIQ